MNATYRTIASAILFTMLSVAPLCGGGYKCPPRQGVIELSGSDIVFVDSADKKTYHLDKAKSASKCIGKAATIVGHPMRLNPTVLVVHEIRCADHQ